MPRRPLPATATPGEKRLREYNLEPVGSTALGFAGVLAKDSLTWKHVIALGGLKME